MTTAKCKDCDTQVEEIHAVPLCAPCFATRAATLTHVWRTLAEEGADFEALLDELRWQVLEMGCDRGHTEKLIDRLRVSVTLGLPYAAVAER